MTHGSAYFFLLPNILRVVVVVVVVVVEALLLAARPLKIDDDDTGMKAETMVGRVRADARRRSDFDCRTNIVFYATLRRVGAMTAEIFSFCQLTQSSSILYLNTKDDNFLKLGPSRRRNMSLQLCCCYFALLRPSNNNDDCDTSKQERRNAIDIPIHTSRGEWTVMANIRHHQYCCC
jgi:hypothetical protein